MDPMIRAVLLQDIKNHNLLYLEVSVDAKYVMSASNTNILKTP